MKYLIFLPVFCLLLACDNTQQQDSDVSHSAMEVSALNYPDTAKGEVADIYFGTEVPDPYRWLEDDLSEETAQWVESQNTVTFDYLNKIPYREALKRRLETLWNYEKISAPFKEGKFTYFYKNDGLQDQSVVYQRADDASEKVFLDPNTFSEDGTTSLTALQFSRDGSVAATLDRDR